MGSICYCCDRQQIVTNESRLRLLQNQVKKSYSTKNDGKFTYYLRMFHQHSFLQKLLNTYKVNTQQKMEDNEVFQTNQNELKEQFKELAIYMNAYKSEDSQLKKKMQKDWLKIQDQLKIYGNLSQIMEYACMVKLQIQSLVLVKGISRLGIIKQFKKSESKKQEQYILINRIKSQMIYRQFVFPNASNSKIKLITDPFSASLTIDVEDLAKQEVICDIFTFKSKSEQYGYVALRMQYITKNKNFLQQKQFRLNILQKELKCCVQGRQGFERLSQLRSSTLSHKNTFISSQMSQFNNQYKL